MSASDTTSTDSLYRPWATPGTKVHKVNNRGSDRTISAALTIAKVGKRDIVLDDDSRFSIHSLYERGREHNADRLVVAGSAEAVEIVREQNRRVRYNRLRAAVDAPTKRTRVSDYTDAELDAIQAALDACRQALAASETPTTPSLP